MTIRELIDEMDKQMAGCRAQLRRLERLKSRILEVCRTDPPQPQETPRCPHPTAMSRG
jgi:hypothetical protein